MALGSIFYELARLHWSLFRMKLLFHLVDERLHHAFTARSWERLCHTRQTILLSVGGNTW